MRARNRKAKSGKEMRGRLKGHIHCLSDSVIGGLGD